MSTGNLKVRVIDIWGTNAIFLACAILVTGTVSAKADNTFPNVGNAGIGTTSPGRALELNVPNQDGIRIRSSGIPRLELDSGAGEGPLSADWVLFADPRDASFGLFNDRVGARCLHIGNECNMSVGVVTQVPSVSGTLQVQGQFAIGHDAAAGITRDSGIWSLRYWVTSGSGHFFQQRQAPGRSYITKVLQVGGTRETDVRAFIADDGTYSQHSSRKAKRDVSRLTSEYARTALLALEPVRFRYRDNPDQEHLGFIAEDVPEAVATADREHVRLLEVIALLTRVVNDQQWKLQEQEKRLTKIVAELDALNR